MKKGYLNILRISKILNIPLSDLKQLTLNEINEIGEGYLQKLENDLNNQMQIMHQTSALISIAVNSPKDFPKEPPKLSIKSDTNVDEKDKLKQLKSTACRIWGM